MPTRRAFFVFIFTLIILVSAWSSGSVFLYLAFCASFSLLFLSYLLSFLLTFNLDIKRYVPEAAYEDDRVGVSIKLRNRLLLLDQSIEIEDNFTAATVEQRKKIIFLNGFGRGSLTFNYQATCFKRGYYKIGPFQIKIFEPLGFFYIQKQLPVFSYLTVYPRIFQVRNLSFVLGHLAPRFGEQTTRISGDYEEFYGIREYHKEDGWRRIHWRSSARRAELMVRHFEQSSQWKATLVLDAHSDTNVGEGKHNAFEYSVKIAASILKFLLFKSAHFNIIASTKKPFLSHLNRGRDHFFNLLNSLAVMEADGRMLLHQLIAVYEGRIASNSSLIIISSDFSPMLIKLLAYLKINKNVGIIPVVLDKESFKAKPVPHSANRRIMKTKHLFSKITTQAYHISCYDDLKLHFVK